MKSFDILILVVLGGLGSLSGAVLAAILLTVVTTFLQDYPETRMIIYSLVLIVMMLYRPQGLMGTKEITSMFKRKGGSSHEKIKTPLLKVDSVGIQFGGLKAVSDVNVELYPGELIGLIGPNGAGKTTFFNLLTGVYVPTEGTISLEGENLRKLPPYKITQKGISRTFQNIRLFSELSVIDNVKVAYHSLSKHGILSSIFRMPIHFKGEKEMDEKAIEFLKIFNLDQYKDEKAKNLPYGKQRRLEIARALAANPKLLLLDEPAAGMNPYKRMNS